MDQEKQICQSCGKEFPPELHRFCPTCGHDSHSENDITDPQSTENEADENEEDVKVTIDESEAAKVNSSSGCCGCVFIFFVLGILGAIAVPAFLHSRSRPQAREKACYANMRVILGATEMYNMDHSDQLSYVDIDRLRQGQYLKSRITPPEPGCSYESNGSLTTDGRVICVVHGPVEFPDK